MSDRMSLDGFTLDAPEPLALARFYADLLDGHVVGHERWAAVAAPSGTLSFQYAPGHRPPHWPDGEPGQQAHLDLLVDDRDAAGARVLAAGGTLAPVQPNGEHCSVYLDPAGHPFCLTTWAMADLVAEPDEA